MHNKNLSYRPDIDGLRAVAVLAVVVYHLNKLWIPGGFAGVDIFFVISGFLITGIVHRQSANGTFSFSEFYLRRVRRIFPAAFLVTFVTLVFGAAFMLPEDFSGLAKSALAATISAANVYFWLYLDTSYFAASSDTVPLLHLWSLGVEEQFYLVWPALMIIAFKIGGRRLVIITASALAIASFAISEAYVSKAPTFAYYMLPSRAGELLAGGLLFFLTDAFKGSVSRVIREIASALGLILIVWSMIFLDEKKGFPGFISLVPTLGAVLIIFAGAYGGSIVGRILSIRPMVAVGLISFSLYLWHWPVLAFYRYAYGEPGAMGIVGCSAIMIACALLAYRLVEKPMRTAGEKKGVKTGAILTAGLLLIAVSANPLILQKIVSGGDQQEQAMKMQATPPADMPYVCQGFGNQAEALMNDDRCVIGPKGQKPKILMVGDSTSSHFVGVFKQIADKYGVSIRNISHPICPMFRGEKSDPYIPVGNAESCRQFNEVVRAHAGEYETIVINGIWPTYAGKSAKFESDIEAMINDFAGHKILIGMSVPMFSNADPKCYAKSLRIPFMDCESRAETPFHFDYVENTVVRQVAQKHESVSTFTLFDIFCHDEKCSSYVDGKPVFWDGFHFSGTGSEIVGSMLVNKNKIPKEIMQALTK